MTVVVTHSTPADSSFSSTGATAWNADHTLTGVGTVAEQDANNVAITGGTINGTTVGSTTAAAGTFTTLTAQTEVLKGTGQNLIFQSQAYNNAYWNQSTATRLDNQTTAPDGSSTAGTITSVNSVYGGLLRQTPVITSTTYTLSAYVKKNNWSYVGLRLGSLNGAGDRYAYFNLDTLATSTNGISGATFTATSVGSGWYRIVLSGLVSASAGAAADVAIVASDGSSATNNGAGQSVYVWGFQLELGSTANTYVPTTTTAVYGTPTLSFSGVASIGLQSDGSLYHQPAGTGAVQAQATTSTATGGNARGANAVDWQTSRSTAAQVASGSQSVIVGGAGNTASGGYSLVAGVGNTSSGFAVSVLGGNSNTASGAYNGVATGRFNSASGTYSFIGGGSSNAAAGFWSTIVGGFTNSGTSASAVTTQSGTMNGTTAVTLSGSNANIKVGQYITGTSIGDDTYVAAISGTSLTLSKVASGSSTSTLSFYTPHGVVVGGGNNQATGSYSFIGGGGDAGTAANRNVASGDWSFVGGGQANTASGLYSYITGGFSSTASAAYSSVTGGAQHSVSGSYATACGGQSNTASSSQAVAIGGFSNVANGLASAVIGGYYGTTRGIRGNTVLPAQFNAMGTSAVGTNQTALLVIGKQTTDATSVVLTSDNSAAGTSNQVILPNNSAYYFKGTVVAGVTGGGNTKGWTVEGVIKRGANAASTAIVGTATVMSAYADVGAATWALTATADTTNGGLAITFTGQAGTTIRVVAKIETTECTY